MLYRRVVVDYRGPLGVGCGGKVRWRALLLLRDMRACVGASTYVLAQVVIALLVRWCCCVYVLFCVVVCVVLWVRVCVGASSEVYA
jgi:hypothetical protein